MVISLADKLNIIQQSHNGATGKYLIEVECAGQSKNSNIKRSELRYLSFMSVLENEDESFSRNSTIVEANKDLKYPIV